MMKQFVLLFGVVMLVLGRNAKSKLNIEQLANVSRFFSTAQICKHEIGVKTQVDSDKRTIISLKVNNSNAKIKPNESNKLCKCMWKYVNQRFWLNETELKCQMQETDLVMTIIGPPNPNYDPLEPLPNEPLATLGDVLKYYPDLDVADHTCSTTTTKTAKGLTSISIECKVTPQSPKPEEVCKNILKWINQREWLGKIGHTCSSKAGNVVFVITGN